MLRFWKIFGILLVVIAISCFSICIYQEGQNKTLLSIGLLCNSLAFLIYCLTIRKKR